MTYALLLNLVVAFFVVRLWSTADNFSRILLVYRTRGIIIRAVVHWRQIGTIGNRSRTNFSHNTNFSSAVLREPRILTFLYFNEGLIGAAGFLGPSKDKSFRTSHVLQWGMSALRQKYITEANRQLPWLFRVWMLNFSHHIDKNVQVFNTHVSSW